MRIFDFDDYKIYTLARIHSLPSQGRGELKRIAEKLRVHPTLMSQVFSGSKNLNSEQAAEICDFFDLSLDETEYYLCLVDIERAGSDRLKNFWKSKQQSLIEKANKISSQFPEAKALSEFEKSKFYSKWYYTAIHLLTDIPNFQNIEAISHQLALPHIIVEEALIFLVDIGMVEKSGGIYSCGPTWIFEPAGSPNAIRHHMNWRMKSLDQLQQDRVNDLFVTLPVTISRNDKNALLTMVREFVSELKRKVEPSAPEGLTVLNIDLFDIC